MLKTVVYRHYTRECPPTALVKDTSANPGEWQWEKGALPAVVFRWNGAHDEARDDEPKTYFFGED
ncbi:MAG TPA: hypothetical protein VEU33_23415 [Archangium sp.]|nr:hypothetical protein [Archangium sp.]